MYKYVFCSIIVLAIWTLANAESHCITADKPEIKKNNCPQLIDDDDEIKKKQQHSIDSAAICNQKRLRETEEQKKCKLEVKKKKKRLQNEKPETKKKKKCVSTKKKIKKPKRNCAIQLRIDKLKSRCNCGIITPSEVPYTDHCFNKSQLTIQLTQSSTKHCSNITETANSTNTIPTIRQKTGKKCTRKSRRSSNGQKRSCIFAVASPIGETKNNIGHNRPKVSVNSILPNPATPKELDNTKFTKVAEKKNRNCNPKQRCNRNEPTGRKRRRDRCTGPESQQCLCNVNIVDCLLGDIPANYLEKLKQQQLEEQKKTRLGNQTCTMLK
ncbi:uncharacterized protein LOC108738549 [Agrilus planipennis]|uniref:Uncharacterized protein LOC108738549 n=1 Tax=Agrilus planipennis TaxID=224129 RepID=A0A1W4X5B0_AGRPL|nr:uncharacterized protein LOC108738549 [Agrilus planipennis]